MRSSISNSDIHLTERFIPGGRWLLPLVVAAAIAALAVAGEEFLLAKRGFVPTIVDSPAIWARERARVDRLGGDALVLIGASHMQLDIDLDAMRRLTGKEPVQLAIDGTSFVPILADLADDERVTGTILVDYQDHVIEERDRSDGAAASLGAWDRIRQSGGIPDFATTEALLGDVLHRNMRSFADGASPWDSLALRVFDERITPQYLVTLPDRTRLADYRKVTMPQFYYARVLRNAGFRDVPSAANWSDFDAIVASRIRSLPPLDLKHFAGNAAAIATYVRKIEARGGRVVFIMFPRSGLVREADERMYPRAVYWDRFLRIVQAPGLNYTDVPALAAFVCPDGAHLDMREQRPFTEALVHALPILRQNSGRPEGRVASAPTEADQEQVR